MQSQKNSVTENLYIRPVGHLPASVFPQAQAMAVAGRNNLRFAAAELIARTGGVVRRILRTAAEILAGVEPGYAPVLEYVRRPRAPIAGLAMDRPCIMGVINVTPDSFSDGGLHFTPQAAIEHGLRLDAEGADFLDIGGESTRPGSDPVDLEEEWQRIAPVLAGLAGRTRARLSVDTRKPEVMRRAVQAGAHVINDVSALSYDPGSLQAAADSGLPIILMHAQGDPRTMQIQPTYSDVVLDVYDALQSRIEACERAGIPRARLVVDPGIGFGKTLAHNLALLGNLSIFHGLGCALMLGASRKSFISRLTGAEPGSRLPGSLAAALLALDQGVQILRVHDVAATRQALAVWEAAHPAQA